jgi:hypothetical protein
VSVTISPETIIAVTKEQVSCELGGEAVILQTGDGVYYGLNTVGNFVWQLLQKEPRPFHAVADAVIAEFQVERAECEGDLTRLFREMAEAKLLTLGS